MPLMKVYSLMKVGVSTNHRPFFDTKQQGSGYKGAHNKEPESRDAAVHIGFPGPAVMELVSDVVPGSREHF